MMTMYAINGHSVTVCNADIPGATIKGPGDMPKDMKLLLRLHNVATGRPLKRFHDLPTAQKAVWDLMPVLVARRPGRRPSPTFSGRALVRVGRTNPCRAGSRRARVWAEFIDGQTYEDYLARGGNRGDLVVLVAQRHIRIVRKGTL